MSVRVYARVFVALLAGVGDHADHISPPVLHGVQPRFKRAVQVSVSIDEYHTINIAAPATAVKLPNSAAGPGVRF